MGYQGQQRPGVIGGLDQFGAHLVAVIGLPVAERAGTNEQRHMAAAHPFCPELLGRPLHVARQSLVHGADLRDALAEAPAADDLLLGLGLLLKLGTGDPPQLLHGALDHHAIAAAQALGVGGDQVGHRLDALRLQLGRQPPANAPYLVHRGDRHQPGAALFITQINDATGCRPLLGCVVGELGQGLGRCNADSDGEAGPLLHPFADLAAISHQVASPAIAQLDKRLVDAVDLHRRGHSLQNAHHTARHVTVEGVVGAEPYPTHGLEELADLEVGHAHLDTERLGFRRTGYHATVVVGEHYDGPPLQIRPKQPLAGGVEVVHIDQCNGAVFVHGVGIRCTTPVTTPKISSSCPSLKWMGRYAGLPGSKATVGSSCSSFTVNSPSTAATTTLP
ncbi:hypothetical protein D3C72_1186560 [compost metagenome]